MHLFYNFWYTKYGYNALIIFQGHTEKLCTSNEILQCYWNKIMVLRRMITIFKLWINFFKCAKKMYKYSIRWENKSHHFLIDTVKKVKVNINMQYWSIVYTIIGFWCQIHNVIVNVTYIELTSRQWLINLYIFIDIILTLLILHESNLNILFF